VVDGLVGLCAKSHYTTINFRTVYGYHPYAKPNSKGLSPITPSTLLYLSLFPCRYSLSHSLPSTPFSRPPHTSTTVVAAQVAWRSASSRFNQIAVAAAWWQWPQDMAAKAAWLSASSCFDDDRWPRRWRLGFLARFARSRCSLRLHRGGAHISLDKEAVLDIHTSTQQWCSTS
jgi:hypothetical protein